MRHRRKLHVIEVLDEALKLLPKPKYYIPKFEDHYFEPVLSLRREPRVDAKGLKARRSKANRRWENWVDVQTITLQEEADWFIYVRGGTVLITTIVNLLILFVATFAILIFMLVFGFFVFIMIACTYIGWQEIKAMPVSKIWERLQKWA